jgi:RNA polymerase sigma-70 factor (ECF subfamily)
LPRFEQRAVPFDAWLFTIAKRHALNVIGRRGRAEPMEPTLIQLESDALARRASTIATMLDGDRGARALLEGLPAKQRRVLGLRFLLDMTPTEIADVCGTTPDAVRHVQHRALRSLSRMLEPASVDAA